MSQGFHFIVVVEFFSPQKVYIIMSHCRFIYLSRVIVPPQADIFIYTDLVEAKHFFTQPRF